MQNRFKSKWLWAAIISNAITIITLTGLDKLIGLDTGMAGDVAGILLDTFVIVGILNNPSDKENF